MRRGRGRVDRLPVHLDGLEADTQHARRLGYTAKSAVHADHPDVINRLLTPNAEEVMQAGRIVVAFEAARSSGRARAELDGSLVVVPIYLNAKRLLSRAKSLGAEKG